MPKKAVSFVFRSKYKRVISIVISVGFFVIYVAFYATLEEREPRELEVPEIAGKVQSMAANVTEVLLFPPNVPPVFTHQIPDYSQKRDGPGENGQGVLLKGIEHSEGESSMKQWFMNVVASDKISLDRSLLDHRSEQCNQIVYSSNLPKASVVIIFTDEAWSVLLRTVHSVINRTPENLLEEVILVDDFSQREELQGKLRDYLRRFGGRVRLLRARNRLGLIRAKIAGAEFARGEVVVFLDSHCEASQGWAEPLLQRISEKRSAVICPVIDMISDHDMTYVGGFAGGIGTFWWSLHYKMDPIPEREQIRRKGREETAELLTPTMAGGLFAANREYFFEVGAYDPGMDIWGGENLEISFRVWMCGGSIEIIPCSHVGHIYRNGHPYNMTGPGGNKDVHGTNSKRLAEVWMDDYKRFFYVQRMGLKDDTVNVGDLSDRKELRKRLNCQSFKWYLDNVIPEKFIPDENVKAYGLVKNVHGILCLDTLQRLENKYSIILGVYNCQMEGSSSQAFSLSKDNQLRRETTCADIDQEPMEGGKKWKVVLRNCSPTSISEFEHIKRGHLMHIRSQLCMDVEGLKPGDDVYLCACKNSGTQKWAFHGTYYSQ